MVYSRTSPNLTLVQFLLFVKLFRNKGDDGITDDGDDVDTLMYSKTNFYLFKVPVKGNIYI